MRNCTILSLILLIGLCGCNRVGTFVAGFLPKKGVTTPTNDDAIGSSLDSTGQDGVIRPDDNSTNALADTRRREGLLTAPGGETFGNTYDNAEYQQMMGSGLEDPSAQLNQGNQQMGAMPGNPEYGSGTLKHPNEEMIGVGGDEYKLFAQGGLKAPSSDQFSNMAANFYSGIENANGEYASLVPPGLGSNQAGAPETPGFENNTAPNGTGQNGNNLPEAIRPKPNVTQTPKTLSSQSLVELDVEGAVPRLGNDVQVMSFQFRYQQLTADRLEGNFFIVINGSNGGGVHAQPIKINGEGKFTVLSNLRPAARPFTAYVLMQQGDRRVMISRKIDVPFNPGF